MRFQIETFGNMNPVVVALLAFGFVTSLVLAPCVKWFAHRIGAVDKGGHRKVFQGAMPLLGGLAVGAPFVAICAVAAVGGWFGSTHFEQLYRLSPRWFNPLYELAVQYRNFAVLALGATVIMLVGIVDDTRGLRAKHKLLAQLIVAVFVCLSGNVLQSISLPLLGEIELAPMFSFGVCVLWIAGMINAMNIIDGVDGLATGISLIAAVALCAIGALNGNLFVFVISLVLAGSLAAFLRYNFNPASIFLGDTGSMLLGFILASLTLMGQGRSDTAMIVLAPMLALSLPIFETMISMARRFVRGLPIFSGDNQHTHHRLLHKGYSQRRVVLMLYSVALMLAASAIMSQALPENSHWVWTPMALSISALVWITWLAGYLRPGSIESVLKRRRRNSLLVALTNYAIQSLGSRERLMGVEEIFNICRSEMRLTFLEARNLTRDLLICSSGQPVEEIPASGHDPVIKTRVGTSTGVEIQLRYQFNHHPDDLESRAVSTALATIFENANISLPPAKVLDLAGDAQIQQLSKHSKTGR